MFLPLVMEGSILYSYSVSRMISMMSIAVYFSWHSTAESIVDLT